MKHEIKQTVSSYLKKSDFSIHKAFEAKKLPWKQKYENMQLFSKEDVHVKVKHCGTNTGKYSPIKQWHVYQFHKNLSKHVMWILKVTKGT